MSSPNATSSAISIGWPSPASSNSSSRSASSYSSTSSTGSTWSSFSFASCASNLSCAYPSWPTRDTLSSSFGVPNNNNNVPSSYINDFDLFPEDLEEGEEPILDEAPALPRAVHAMPLLPIFASQRSRNKKRRCSRKPLIKVPGAMTPIAESPVATDWATRSFRVIISHLHHTMSQYKRWLWHEIFFWLVSQLINSK